jgi:hypothetical protein
VLKSCNRIIKALKTNCISIEDERSDLGKLHCIIDTVNMEDDGIGVTASINPGPLSFDGLADTQVAKDTYLIGYYAQKDIWIANKNLKEAANRFLMSRIDPTYFRELAHAATGYKGVTIEELIFFLQEEYPPEPEDVMEHQKSLLSEWDPNNHIHDLFDSVKLGVSGKLDNSIQLVLSGKHYQRMKEKHYGKLEPTLETSIRCMMHNEYHYTRQE